MWSTPRVPRVNAVQPRTSRLVVPSSAGWRNRCQAPTRQTSGTTSAADPIEPRTIATTTPPTGPAPCVQIAAAVTTAAAMANSPTPSRRCASSRSRAPVPTARAAEPTSRASRSQRPAISRNSARPSRIGSPGRRLRRCAGRRERLDTGPPRRVAGPWRRVGGVRRDEPPDRGREAGRAAVRVAMLGTVQVRPSSPTCHTPVIHNRSAPAAPPIPIPIPIPIPATIMTFADAGVTGRDSCPNRCPGNVMIVFRGWRGGLGPGRLHLDDERDDHRPAPVVVADPAADHPPHPLRDLVRVTDAVGCRIVEGALDERHDSAEHVRLVAEAARVDLGPPDGLAGRRIDDHHDRDEAFVAEDPPVLQRHLPDVAHRQPVDVDITAANGTD